jgi:hypothetical protein
MKIISFHKKASTSKLEIEACPEIGLEKDTIKIREIYLKMIFEVDDNDEPHIIERINDLSVEYPLTDVIIDKEAYDKAGEDRGNRFANLDFDSPGALNDFFNKDDGLPSPFDYVQKYPILYRENFMLIEKVEGKDNTYEVKGWYEDSPIVKSLLKHLKNTTNLNDLFKIVKSLDLFWS